MLNRKLAPEAQIRIGLLFLIFASLTKWFLRPGAADLSERWADGIAGLLYGVSIAFMLLGIWRKSRQASVQREL